MAKGIKDKVAILGMGCARFGERWDMSAEELMVEAFIECLEDAGIEKKEIQAAYLGTLYPEQHLGVGGISMSLALKLPNIACTRVENICATGTEAFRAACYSIAAGAYDIVLALGVEKLKDIGYGGLPSGLGMPVSHHMHGCSLTTPGSFAQFAMAYSRKWNMPLEKVKDAMSHISAKSHANGALNPRAHLRRPVTVEEIKAAPMIAYPLGLFDCCGVSDGSACAIVTTPEIAKSLKKNQNIVNVKALSVISCSGGESFLADYWDGAHVVTTRIAAAKAYEEAGIKDPRKEISMIEVHDCFSIAEMVVYEDLGISPKGGAYDDIMDGFYDLDGKIPCQADGGNKCFGHPLGATGLRMIYSIYEQLLERVPEERKVKNVRLGLTHNLGGFPDKGVTGITIVGLD